MLVENDKVLKIDELVRIRPILYKSKSRELKLLRFVDNNDLYDGTDIFCFDGIFSFFRQFVGVDCIICDPNNFFASIMLEFNENELCKSGRISSGDMGVAISSKDKTFFTIRSGNHWGSVWIWSDDLSPSELGIKVKDILDSFKQYGWDAGKILPPPKMFERLLIEKTSFWDFQNIFSSNIDEKVWIRAWNCFRGGRMESAKLGLCKNVYDYDYNSAYFSILRDLPSLRLMNWIDSKEYIKDAYFGFCKCYIDIDENAPIGLVPIRIGIDGRKTRLFYTVGDNVSWRTKDDIDLINRSGFGRVEILEGSWGISDHECPKSFYEVSNILRNAIFDVRSKSMAKAMASVCWGKFASVDSSWFNPIYAAFITSRIRTRITEIALLMEKDLVAVTIDGLALEKEIPKKDIISGEIGFFKRRLIESMISLSDVYRYEHDKPSSAWVPNNDGIYINELDITIPFGSSKRRSPKKLSFDILKKEQFLLSPPTSEDAVELYLTTKETVPWDVW